MSHIQQTVSPVLQLDAAALAWQAAVVANGGTCSPRTLIAVDTFVKATKASGYWTKLNRLNLFCGDQLAACLVPLKIGGGNATDTNVNFVSGDYTEATGLAGNGTTKYLKTGLVANTLTLNDTSLAVYNRSANATNASCAIGARDGAGSQYIELFPPFNDGFAYARAYGATSLPSSAVSAPYGLISSSRTSSTLHRIYKGNTQIASDATASVGGLPNLEIYVFATNSVGTVALQTAQVFGSYSVGASLSAADVTAYNTAMQAFQTALGRNV